jgi:hypothetical protein
MRRNGFLRFLGVFLLSIGLNSCGGGGTSPIVQPPAQNGTVAVIGTDAPMGNVLAFRVMVTGLTISNGSSTVSILTAPVEVEFSRLNGLRSLIDLRSVPAGSYTSFTATLASPMISVLDASVTPPAVQTINATLTESSVNLNLTNPLVVTDGGLVALIVDLRLADSIMTDANGQITGQVRPRIALRAIPPDAPEAEIDEIRGGVVSVDVAGGTFVMQGPHGRTLTVAVDAQTNFEPGESLATLGANAIVEVSGFLQRGTLRLRATEVEVLTRDRFAVGGLITHVRPSPGPADEIDVLIRTEIPDLVNAQAGRISTFGFNGNERFAIHHLRLPFAPFLFNRSSLVAGQRVAVVGEILAGNALDARGVILHQQGLEGAWIPGSNAGQTFRMDVAGVTGTLFGGPVRVITGQNTRFIGLSGVSDLTGANPIRLRVVGLVLQDDNTGRPIVIARVVERITQN